MFFTACHSVFTSDRLSKYLLWQPKFKIHNGSLTLLVLTHYFSNSRWRSRLQKAASPLTHLGLPLFLLLHSITLVWKEVIHAGKQPCTASAHLSHTPRQQEGLGSAILAHHIIHIPCLDSTALGWVKTKPSASFTGLPEPCSWSCSALSEV